MKGFRTVIVAAIGSMLTPWLTAHLGITLTAEQQTQLVGLVMGALMIGMRCITTGPIGTLANKSIVLTAENVLQHIDISALIKLIADEVATNRKQQESTKS